MSLADIQAAFRAQAIHCNNLGSPFTARLCTLLADRLGESGAVAHHLANWPGTASHRADAVPLRLAGGLHALVLQGRESALQAAYPPHMVDDDTLWAAIARALDRHAPFLLDWLKSPPQTNEVRRASALIPGFHLLASQRDLPFVTSEIGASGGLNMGWDQFALHIAAQVWGPAGSPVQLTPDWTGPTPPRQDVQVIERAGCDLNPLDANDPADKLRLRAYLWADQPDRLTRTDGAIEVQTSFALPKVARMDALDFLRARLSAARPGAWHVIYHTIMWQYLPEAAQKAGEALIASAGARASAEAPLAWLRMEADGKGEGAAVTLTTWPEGETRQIARADFHGRWLRWQG
tara:strand:- start:1645 stop:2691 length:1047 start_codon:yes stop_codon:yes gene_type:complete